MRLTRGLRNSKRCHWNKPRESRTHLSPQPHASVCHQFSQFPPISGPHSSLLLNSLARLIGNSNEIKKVSKTMGIISRACFFLLNLCYPYTKHWFTHLNYCNIAWCSTYPSNLNRILYLQKHGIVRIICGAEYLAHTAPLFWTLKSLDIFNINALLI